MGRLPCVLPCFGGLIRPVVTAWDPVGSQDVPVLIDFFGDRGVRVSLPKLDVAGSTPVSRSTFLR